MKSFWILPVLGAAVFLSRPAAAEEIVAVLSSESAPYQEALAGVQETLGKPLAVIHLAQGGKIPQEARVVIAIGGKAAVAPYPDDMAFIYCVAPGLVVESVHRAKGQIKVYVSPDPKALIPKLKELQPSLKRLGVLWNSDSSVQYSEDMLAAGRQMGVGIRFDHVQSPKGVPEGLRALKGLVDALWLPPDPLLITPETFEVFRQFSLSNDIPLYVPIDALADKGATAAIFISFREMGRQAGRAAARLLTEPLERSEIIYSNRIAVTVNASAALESGLHIPPEVLKKVDRTIP